MSSGNRDERRGLGRQSLLEDLRDLVRTEIPGVVKHELENHASFKKNGESWKGWLWKVLTPERIGVVLLAILMFGGDLRDAKRDLKAAVDRAVTATEVANTAAAKAEEATQQMLAVKKDIADVVTSLKQQSTVNEQLNDRVAMAVTRSEFRTAVIQQILPRLERIEKRLGEVH